MSVFSRKGGQSADSPEAIAQYWESIAKSVQLNNMKLQEQNSQVTLLTETYRAESRKNMGELQRVAQTICDNDFSREQLGGKNRILSLSAFELANFIIENWKKQRAESINLIVDLQKESRKLNLEKADLEAQLGRMMEREREMAWVNQEALQTSQPSPAPAQPQFSEALVDNSGNVEEIVEQHGQKINKSTGEILESDPPVTDILKVVSSQGHSSEQHQLPAPPIAQIPDGTPAIATPKTHLVLLEEMESKLSDLQWKIIAAIGTDGLSESKEIEQTVLGGDSNRTQYVNGLNGLKTTGILSEDKVNTGWRWFYAYHMTDLGLQMYQKRFRKPAILCEKHILKKENASWDHGYTIKDTATLLDQFGYVQISYNRKDNEIELTNKKVWIPDITAYDNLSRKKMFIEVECANHTQPEFNEKMDKARQVTSDLRFVCPDKAAMETIVSQFSKWKLEKTKGGAPVKNFEVWITTTKKLSEKDWGQNYPS